MPDETLVQLTKRKGMLIFFERAPHSGLIKRLSVAVGKTRLAGWLDAGLDYTKQFNMPDDGIRGCLYKQYDTVACVNSCYCCCCKTRERVSVRRSNNAERSGYRNIHRIILTMQLVHY